MSFNPSEADGISRWCPPRGIDEVINVEATTPSNKADEVLPTLPDGSIVAMIAKNPLEAYDLRD